MPDTYCGRWMQRSACILAECLFDGQCAFNDFEPETNAAFNEALDKSKPPRPRLLDDDGSIQLCEQCNNDDGKAIEIGTDGIRVYRVWAHNAFDSGVCRWVYMCHACFWVIQEDAYGGKEPWFGPGHEMYGVHEDCTACRAELRT